MRGRVAAGAGSASGAKQKRGTHGEKPWRRTVSPASCPSAPPHLWA